MKSPIRLSLVIAGAALLLLGNSAFGAAEADVALSYAPSYASSVGGDDNAQVLLANTVAGNNLVNDRSGTGAHMRIAGFYKSANDPINATTTGGMVGWLSGNDSHVSDVVSYGASVGADLVCYICQNSDSGSIAAVAQQPGMYSALNPGAVFYPVFAHETGGHNYGRSHSDGILLPKTIMLHNYCGGGSAPPYYYTNPLIWFNGVQLLGNTGSNCSMGGLVNGGDNSQPTADSAQGVADRRARVVVGPNLSNLVYRWQFNKPAGSAPTGTAISDSVSGASATVRGNGAVFTGTGLRIPGGTTGNVPANSISAYIDLPNGIISSRTNITIEIWATPLSAPNWARLFDFGRTDLAGDGTGAPGEYTGAPGAAAPGSTQSSDDIMLSVSSGTNIGTQRFEAKLNGTAVTLDSGLATTAGVQHLYTVTFTDGAGDYGSAGGRWQWYRDGDPVAFLDVNYHLSSIEDVNNWLGRSMYTSDSMANNEYNEVRISSVALTRGQVLANYLLGPNYDASSTTMLTASDAAGASSFNAAGQWSNGAAPSGANSYETFDFLLRTPAANGAYAFGGSSLKISGGSLLWKGTASNTVTVGSLILKGGTVQNAGSGTFTLAGNVSVAADGATFNDVNGPVNVSANLSGSGPVTYVANAATLSGSNSAFTGKTLVGNGTVGTLIIDAKARLGAAPGALTADQLTFNRGTLQTTATMGLDDPTRGIYFDVAGGTFNVAAGTTLTVSSPLSSVNLGSATAAGAITKSGAGTLVLNSAGSTFNGTLYVDTNSTGGNNGIVRVASNQALANAHSPIFINNNNAGSSMLQLDGTTGNIALPQRVSLAGRNLPGAAIDNLTGANSIAGVSLIAGGANYILQSDAGALNFTGTVSSAVNGTRTVTLQGNGDFLISNRIENGTADQLNLVKNGTGTLTLSGTGAHTGSTTINAGNFVLNGSLATAGTLTTAAGTTFSGFGTTSAAVTINGTHAPGNGTGSQSFTGALNYASGARLRWTLVANSTATGSANQLSAGAVSVNGASIDLTLNAVGSQVNYFDAFWTQSQSWNFVGSTSLSGTFSLGNVSADAAGRAAGDYGAFSLTQTASGITVTWTPKTFTAWRGTNFGAQASDPLVAGLLNDPDGDSIPNLMEYFCNDNPKQADGSPAQSSVDNNRLALSFTRNAAAVDVTATVQGADSPAGPWTDLARSVGGAPFSALAASATANETGSGTARSVEVRDMYDVNDAAHPKRFLRLQVQY